ncbi:hypothetical protein BH20ACT3_BH20ACT3_17480 [soil metagenome]
MPAPTTFEALTDLVDADRYPVDRPHDPMLRSVIGSARADLARTGCALLEGFVRADAHDTLRAETAELAPLAHTSAKHITAYSDAGVNDWPADHPRRRLLTMTNGFVTKDQIPDDTLVQRLYRSRDFERLIAACLSKERIFPFADPMRGLVANVMRPGDELPWHFDANEFVVSLMTKRAENGGTFEYCPDIRTAGDERYGDVRAVLDGGHDGVHRLDLEVGDLQIFQGRYSMHRVVPGDSDRHTVVFGFSEMPDYVGGVETARLVYGRALQAHIDADSASHDDGLAGR